MDDREARLRETLAEIERLMDAARAKDVAVEKWIEQVAGELRDSLPEQGGAGLARRIVSHPQLSLSAQAHVAAGALRALKG
jgi:hypothetical protein